MWFRTPGAETSFYNINLQKNLHKMCIGNSSYILKEQNISLPPVLFINKVHCHLSHHVTEFTRKEF